MKECKNILTYLETDCWKLPKGPLTLASVKKSIHTYCLLIALRNFFLSLGLFVFCCNAVCLWLPTISAFRFLFSFLSPNMLFYFSPSIFLGIPSVFKNQTSPFWIIYINIYTRNLWQIKLYSWYNHSSTTSTAERDFRKFGNQWGGWTSSVDM